jgi:hypothetical protein
MGELAVAYRVLCRHQEALAMNEQALKFMRRVLPENHPDISMMFLLTSCYHSGLMHLHICFQVIT